MLINYFKDIIDKAKGKPRFSFGEIDSKFFRTLYFNGKETKIKLYHCSEYNIDDLKKAAEILYLNNKDLF